MNGNITTLTDLVDLVLDERDAWSILMARAVGNLNGRRLWGFKKLKRSKKKCMYCGERAEISVVYSYREKVFSEYYCKRCFLNHFIEDVRNFVKEQLYTILNELLRWLESDRT